MSERPPSETVQALLRRLPSVDHLLNQPSVAALRDEYAREELLAAIRDVLAEQRRCILERGAGATELPEIALAIRQRLYDRSVPSLRRVINATGVVLHTGLGRAPLSEAALDAMAEASGGYCSLELNLETGERGQRHDHLRALLSELTGAEDGIVVNNNAAATFLALNALAAEREVIVSRGQLVEIGGSYRMPDIMAAAGCRMIEVGTTNRTHLRDYERAINDQTAALLRVHTSNYRVCGFVTSPETIDLAPLAKRHNLLVIDDLGSGLLHRDIPWPPQSEDAPSVPGPEQWDEPTVRDSVRHGADLTLFSGDKLLGGPQAGVLVGRADLIEALRGSPLARAFRPDKTTLAGMEATLRLYRDRAAIPQRIPVYRLLSTPLDALRRRAERLASALAQFVPETDIEAAPDDSYAGGGSLPTLRFPTWIVTFRVEGCTAQALSAALRQRELPIVARVHSEAVTFDCRTISDAEIDEIASAVADVVREHG